MEGISTPLSMSLSLLFYTFETINFTRMFRFIAVILTLSFIFAIFRKTFPCEINRSCVWDNFSDAHLDETQLVAIVIHLDT